MKSFLMNWTGGINPIFIVALIGEFLYYYCGKVEIIQTNGK